MSSSSSGSSPAQHVPKRGRGRPRLRRNIRIESTPRTHPDYRKLTRALVGIVQSNPVATEPRDWPAGSAPFRAHAPQGAAHPPQPATSAAAGGLAPHAGAESGVEAAL